MVYHSGDACCLVLSSLQTELESPPWWQHVYRLSLSSSDTAGTGSHDLRQETNKSNGKLLYIIKKNNCTIIIVQQHNCRNITQYNASCCSVRHAEWRLCWFRCPVQQKNSFRWTQAVLRSVILTVPGSDWGNLHLCKGYSQSLTLQTYYCHLLTKTNMTPEQLKLSFSMSQCHTKHFK